MDEAAGAFVGESEVVLGCFSGIGDGGDMVLFEKLPKAKEFRDVRVIMLRFSGLAACRR